MYVATKEIQQHNNFIYFAICHMFFIFIMHLLIFCILTIKFIDIRSKGDGP